MADRKFLLFIKAGDEFHMKKLLNEGEVFCKTLKYFSQEEQNTLRHDKYEGAGQIEQIKNIEMFLEDGKTLLGKAPSGQLYFHDSELSGNIFCMYGVETESLNLEDGIIKPFVHDLSDISFGKFGVLIFKPGIFLKRVEREVKKMGFEFKFSPITYYDPRTYLGALSPFHKSNVFSKQNEIRFWIPNHLNEDLIFKIGDINDIAKILPLPEFSRLGFRPD